MEKAKTKQEIEDKYWLEFIVWLQEGINYHSGPDDIVGKFWCWFVNRKSKELKRAKVEAY